MTTSAVPFSRILLYAGMTSLTALSIDAILPGLRFIAADLGPTPPFTTQHVIVLFVFGMAFGELFVGPISDAIGRKRALVGGIVLYAIGALLAVLAQSFGMVLIGRFIQGLGVAGPKIATRATIRDQFEGDAMARVMSFMFTLFIFVPMLAPAFGQGVIALSGWRSVFALSLMLALGLGLWFATRHPETLPAGERIPFRPRLLILNARNILASRRVSLLIIAAGLVFGGQLLFLSTAADLFLAGYGIDDLFPLCFALLASGVGLASFANGKLVGRFGAERMARAGLAGMGGASALMLAAALLSAGQPPLSLFLLLGFAVFASLGLIFGNLNAMAMQPLGRVAGIGASLIASLSSLIASLYAAVAGVFYDTSVTWLAAGFLVAALAAMLLMTLALRSNASTIVSVR